LKVLFLEVEAMVIQGNGISFKEYGAFNEMTVMLVDEHWQP
jgi:hypothetical protein